MRADATEAPRQGVHGKVPDLLVTATRMPRINGFALARSLRESAPDLPVLYLAGPDASDAGARARDLDFDDMLPRPVFVRELVARVTLLLAKRVQRAVASDVRHGSTADLALADLLQSLEASHLTGIVHLAQDGEEARVYVREGNVVDAELGRMRGADVVVRTLSWDRATFRVEPGPVDNPDLIECTTHALLLRAMDRIDDRTPAPCAISFEQERAPAGRESSPSTAPWTREPSSDAPTDPDVLAAGLPRRDARALRRVVVVGCSAAAALGVVGVAQLDPRTRRTRGACRGDRRRAAAGRRRDRDRALRASRDGHAGADDRRARRAHRAGMRRPTRPTRRLLPSATASRPRRPCRRPPPRRAIRTRKRST